MGLQTRQILHTYHISNNPFNEILTAANRLEIIHTVCEINDYPKTFLLFASVCFSFFRLTE